MTVNEKVVEVKKERETMDAMDKCGRNALCC